MRGTQLAQSRGSSCHIRKSWTILTTTMAVSTWGEKRGLTRRTILGTPVFKKCAEEEIPVKEIECHQGEGEPEMS